MHKDIGKTCYRMTTNIKAKTIDNKIKQKKAQYDLDRQTVKISAVSSENLRKYQLLTDEDVLPGKT